MAAEGDTRALLSVPCPSAEDEVITTGDLLNAWREATRAAELAERLARLALDAAEQADASVAASEEIVGFAESAASAAEQAALTARKAADRARQLASMAREGRLNDANEAVSAARHLEAEARNRFHAGEREAQRRQGDGPDQ